MTVRDDEKFTQNVKDIVEGVGRIVDSVGQVAGQILGRNNPRAAGKDNDMGRNHDDDNDGIGPIHTKGAVLRTGIEGEMLLVQICEADGKVVKQVRLTVEESEAHIKDMQRKLRAIKDD